MNAEPIVVEAHAGWRHEIGDTTPRVQLGAEARRAWLGVELNAGTRLAPTDDSGHLASQMEQENDAGWWVMRDDRWTGSALLAVRPWPHLSFGPVLAAGAEMAATQTVVFDSDSEDWVVARTAPVPTGWLIVRPGVEARFGRFGARLTFADRMSWLRVPEMDGPGDPALVEVWRVGIDLLVRVR